MEEKFASQAIVRYGIRKVAVGAASVAIGLALFGQVTTVSAAEVLDETVAEETVTTEPTDEATTEALSTEDVSAVSEAPLSETEIVTTGIESAATYGEEAYEHVDYLSNEIGARIAGTDAEYQAKEYIKNELTADGYEVSEQAFAFDHKDETVHSHNISALKVGEDKREIILGAHYDSVNTDGSIGADDNASGVGIMLEMAHIFSKQTTPYSIRFIAFGAEEMGLQGSQHYVDNMTSDQIKNTIAMINLDSLIGGDKAYVYAGLDDQTWVAEQALQIAKELQLPLTTNPGLNTEYPAGKTGDWSDHVAFRKAGIPVAYFESTNWEIGDLDGYNQTELVGPIMHTEHDNLAYLEKTFLNRVRTHLHTHATVLYHLLADFKLPETPVTNEEEKTIETVVTATNQMGKEKTDEKVTVLTGIKAPAKDAQVKQLVTSEHKVQAATKESVQITKAAMIEENALPQTGVTTGLSTLGLLLTGLGSVFVSKKQKS